MGKVKNARRAKGKLNPRPRGAKWPDESWGFHSSRVQRRLGTKSRRAKQGRRK